jgi:hypothetical protein
MEVLTVNLNNINPLALIALLVAVLSLLGPALLYAGITIGTLRSTAKNAHKRIDRLETLLTHQFEQLRGDLKESIATAWRNCPLAHNHKEE